MPPQARIDLKIWAAAIVDSARSFPIPHRPLPPSFNSLHFVSDAAGARYIKIRKKKIPCETPGDRGAAAIGICPSGAIWLCSRVTWPTHLLMYAKDEKGKAYGCKSTTLEMVGLLLPIITVPHLLQGHKLCFHVDNIAVVHGWANRGVKRDKSASILIRTLHLVASFLGCIVHVRHLPRMSTPDARLADRLSRKHTTRRIDTLRIRQAIKPPIPPALARWLRNPKVDWDLPMNTLRDVQDLLSRGGS
jgi:hypothetical protein